MDLLNGMKDTLLKDFDSDLVTREKEELLMNVLINSPEVNLLFDHCVPLNRFLSFMAIVNMMSVKLINGGVVENAFMGTKESLKTLFNILDKGEDYISDNRDESIIRAGGTRGLESLLANRPEKMCGKDLKELAERSGYNYWQVIEFILKTPLQLLRGLTEITDPCIAIASKVALFSRVFSGQDIPVEAVALALQPSTLAPGLWFGPPLLPTGMLYLALGLGFSGFGSELDGESTSCMEESLGINTNSGLYKKCDDEEE
jgi:hypothetical protein